MKSESGVFFALFVVCFALVFTAISCSSAGRHLYEIKLKSPTETETYYAPDYTPYSGGIIFTDTTGKKIRWYGVVKITTLK